MEETIMENKKLQDPLLLDLLEGLQNSMISLLGRRVSTDVMFDEDTAHLTKPSWGDDYGR